MQSLPTVPEATATHVPCRPRLTSHGNGGPQSSSQRAERPNPGPRKPSAQAELAAETGDPRRRSASRRRHQGSLTERGHLDRWSVHPLSCWELSTPTDAPRTQCNGGSSAPTFKSRSGSATPCWGTITAGGNVFIVAGGLLLSRIADNSNRARLVALATVFWSAMTLLLGFVQTAFWFFIVNCAIAFGRSQTHPVQGAIMGRQLPHRGPSQGVCRQGCGGTIGCIHRAAGRRRAGLVDRRGTTLGAGGSSPASIPTLIVGVAILFLTDPPRGTVRTALHHRRDAHRHENRDPFRSAPPSNGSSR